MTATPRWLNFDPDQELRVESRVTRSGLAIILLQRHPEAKRTWCPVASWGRCLEFLECEDPRVLLELRALKEGLWKLAEFTAYAKKLVISISQILKSLLKLSNRTHPTLQALVIDLLQYKPKFIVPDFHDPRAAPSELGMEAPPVDVADLQEKRARMDERFQVLSALKQPMHLPPKAQFIEGDSVHVQFDGGAQDGVGTGGFVILDKNEKEVVRVGRFYGPGRTNNEAEAFALRDAMQCVARL